MPSERRFAGRTRPVMLLVRRRRTLSLLLVTMGAVLSVGLIGSATISRSASDAVSESTVASFGHRQFAVQSSDASVGHILDGQPDSGAVVDNQATLTFTGLSTDVLVRTTTDAALQLGILSSGTRPSEPGEIAVSRFLATALRIHLGDQVSLRSGDGDVVTGRVTGTLVDPADASSRVVTELKAKSAQIRATRWLVTADLLSDRDLGGTVDTVPGTQVASVNAAVAAAQENRPRALADLSFLPAVFGVLLGGVLLTFVVGLATSWPTDAVALRAAGMSSRAAWGIFMRWLLLCVACGEAVGAVAAVILVTATKGAVSRRLGQDWVHVSEPLTAIGVLLGTTAVVAIVGPSIVRWVSSQHSLGAGTRARAQARGASVVSLVFAAALFGWLLLVVVDVRAGGGFLLAAFSGAVVCATAPLVLQWLASRGLTPSVAKVQRALSADMRQVTAVCSVVVFAAALWSARTYSEAAQSQYHDNPMQPRQSLVLSEMPDSAIAVVGALYREYGGREVLRYQMPREQSRVVRVTSPGLIGCLEARSAKTPDEAPASCWPRRTASPINAIGLARGIGTVRADPGLVTGGKVGLIVLDTRSPEPIQKMSVVDASTDQHLGGIVPGLVVPRTGPLATQLRLEPSGVSEMIMLDYIRLTPEERLRLRAEVGRVAPTALVNDGTGPSAYDRARLAASLGGLFGGVLGGTLLLLGGYAALQTARVARRVLQELGPLAGLRWSLMGRWVAVPATATVLAGVLALVTASWGGRVTQFPFGPLWAAPVALSLVAVAVLGTWFLVPVRQSWHD